MSTLEKTINLEPAGTESLDDIFGNIVGAVPDTGKTLEEYREERIRENGSMDRDVRRYSEE